MRTSRRFTRPPAHIRGPARRCFSRLGLVSFRFVMASSRGRERAQQRGPRVFVFGSSTPRDLSHMNKVGPRSPAPTPPDSHPPQEVRRPDSQGEQRRPEPQRLHAEGQVPDPGRWAVSPFFPGPSPSSPAHWKCRICRAGCSSEKYVSGKCSPGNITGAIGALCPIEWRALR